MVGIFENEKYVLMSRGITPPPSPLPRAAVGMTFSAGFRRKCGEMKHVMLPFHRAVLFDVYVLYLYVNDRFILIFP